MLKTLYRIPCNPVVKGCVYKLVYDGKYVIVKAKEMQQSAERIQKGLNQFIREMAGQHKPDNLYIHLYNYVKEHPGKEFSYEVLLESDSGYRLLVAEHKQLKKVIKDHDCLNNNVEPYIPQYNEEKGQYGWLTKTDVLNFKKWLHRYGSKAPAKKKRASKKKVK